MERSRENTSYLIKYVIIMTNLNTNIILLRVLRHRDRVVKFYYNQKPVHWKRNDDLRTVRNMLSS